MTNRYLKTLHHTILILGTLFMLLFGISCEKETRLINAGTDVEIYLLQKYSVLQGTDEIIHSSVVMENEPLVSYDQILEYNAADHSFRIAEPAIKAINREGGLRCHFKAFAVTVDREVIYTGYFWPAYSSTIKQYFIIDPILYDGKNRLTVQKAYPTNSYAGNYKDFRNDSRILDIFRRDGKLKNE
jgi:hypothetical protein